MLKDFIFEIGQEVAIVSRAQDLSKLRGDKAIVVCLLPTSHNHDYIIKLEDNAEIKVKQKEIQAIIKELLDIRTGDKVLVMPKEELATVMKIDFLHGHVNVQFESDGAYTIVGIEQIRKYENEGENVEDYKFKNGDKVKVNTEDEWNGEVGEVVRSYTEVNVKGYDVLFGDSHSSFDEYELELDEEVNTSENGLNEETLSEELLNVFLGQYKNSDNTYTVPKELLINLIEAQYEEVKQC